MLAHKNAQAYIFISGTNTTYETAVINDVVMLKLAMTIVNEEEVDKPLLTTMTVFRKWIMFFCKKKITGNNELGGYTCNKMGHYSSYC